MILTECEIRLPIFNNIGSGSYGSVFKAVKNRTDEAVAIKVIKKELVLFRP
jgi:serine/threonine protein kinase